MTQKTTPFSLTELAQSLPSTVPFQGPEAQERARGSAFKARLGANESIFGASPKVIEAVAAAAGEMWKYADPESADLRGALAAHHGVAAENIVLGEGIDGLLGVLVRLMVGAGDPVVTSTGAYPTFNYHVVGFGGRIETVPFKDDHEDPDALIAKAAETGAKLIYISNPDNPMGTVHSAARMQAMIDAVPAGSLLILDEAYIELAPDDCAPAIDPEDTSVIRMRTFSKGYGMAGARVGYAIGHRDLIQSFDKVRNHFGMPKLSQIAAEVALADQDYLAQVQEKVARARAQLSQIAKDNGLVPIPSATNFVTMDCGQDGDFAVSVLGHLLELGIFVRKPFVAPEDRCIRVSVGTDADLALFADALPKALCAARDEL